MNARISRRTFLRTASSAAFMLSTVGFKAGSTGPDPHFEYGDGLSEFPYDQVRLLASPQQEQLEQTHRILMGLNEDSLLRPFRLAARLPAPGNDMEGWYHTERFLGETFGQWISALSRYHAATGDAPSREKVARLVAGFAEAIEPSGRIYKRPIALGPLTAAYTYDKLTCGLIDAAKHARIPDAHAVLDKVRLAARAHLPGRAVDYFERQAGATEGGAFESYTLPENQFLAWQRGAGSDYLEMARTYLQDSFFEALARGENILAGRHAYSHVNALCSAAKAYLVVGDRKYLEAAVNGFRFIEEQSFATGGWGPGETFLPRPAVDYTDPNTGEQKHIPALKNLGQSLTAGQHHFETPCGSYAQFKLTRYLLRITREPRFGDSMERVMYNGALGALPITKFGNAFYQSQYGRRARKEYFDGYDHVIEDEWPCCSGTLPQLAADYGISTYLRDKEGIFVNLYLPSSVRWSEGGCDLTLRQTGEYPLADKMTFTLKVSRPVATVLRFRIPSWAQSPSIAINGSDVTFSVRPGTFAEIRRTWSDGDTVELTLPAKLELKAVDAAHPDTVALCSGPLVLFAVGDDLPKLTRESLLAARQLTPGAQEWRSGSVRFLPWWKVRDEVYTTYHDL